jgi:hypothetical protein
MQKRTCRRLLIFATVAVLVGGGGVAAATSHTQQHSLAYTTAATRTLTLANVPLTNSTTVQFGTVALNQMKTTAGPVLQYSTDNPDDKITAVLDTAAGVGITLQISVAAPTGGSCSARGANEVSYQNLTSAEAGPTPGTAAAVEVIGDIAVCSASDPATAATNYRLTTAGALAAGEQVKDVTFSLEADN